MQLGTLILFGRSAAAGRSGPHDNLDEALSGGSNRGQTRLRGHPFEMAHDSIHCYNEQLFLTSSRVKRLASAWQSSVQGDGKRRSSWGSNQIKAAAIFCVATAALLATGPANSQLITNGSFETPTVPIGSFTNFTVGTAALTGWNVIGPAGTNVSIVSTSFSQGGVAFEAESGVQWLDLTGNGSNSTEGVSQTIATTAGDKYQLSFYVGNTTGGAIFGTTSTGDVLLNGAQSFVATNKNVSPTTLNWQLFTYNFVATGASTSLAFVNGDPSGDNSNGLDNIFFKIWVRSQPFPSPQPTC